MGQPHHLRLRVRHYEVDVYGHVNHAHYVHYLETGRIEALDAIDLSIDDMKRQGYLIFAADLFIKYHSPARLGDELDILTYIRESRGARSIWVQEIREAITQASHRHRRGDGRLYYGERPAGSHARQLY